MKNTCNHFAKQNPNLVYIERVCYWKLVFNKNRRFKARRGTLLCCLKIHTSRASATHHNHVMAYFAWKVFMQHWLEHASVSCFCMSTSAFALVNKFIGAHGMLLFPSTVISKVNQNVHTIYRLLFVSHLYVYVYSWTILDVCINFVWGCIMCNCLVLFM